MIDIDDINATVRLLQYLIDNDEIFEKRKQMINISRESILNKYNIFNLMQNMAVNKASKTQNIKLNTNSYYANSFIKKLAKFILKYR